MEKWGTTHWSVENIFCKPLLNPWWIISGHLSWQRTTSKIQQLNSGSNKSIERCSWFLSMSKLWRLRIYAGNLSQLGWWWPELPKTYNLELLGNLLSLDINLSRRSKKNLMTNQTNGECMCPDSWRRWCGLPADRRRRSITGNNSGAIFTNARPIWITPPKNVCLNSRISHFRIT